jgi:Tfp pilus assembly protein PilF
MMGYLDQVTHFDNIFWCERKGAILPDHVTTFLDKKNGKHVEIEGFDEIMFLLQDKLKLPLLDKNIEVIAKERADKYRETIQTIQKTQSNSKDKTVLAAAENIAKKAGDGWLGWVLKAEAADTNEEKNAIYKEGLVEFPESAELNGLYGTFLHVIRSHDEAEKYYKISLKLAPDIASTNAGYAILLNDVKRLHDEAEKYYKMSLKLKPNDPNFTASYARFLHDVRDSHEEADKYYRMSISSDPTNANNIGNYVGFLLSLGKKVFANMYLEIALRQCHRNDVLAELQFYLYAHYSERRVDALKKLRKLLCDGVRSLEFNLQHNVNRAIIDGHPDAIMLQRLADILTKDAPIGDLCTKSKLV